MESIQRRDMSIIFYHFSYLQLQWADALSALSLTTLNERRESTCVRSTRRENHPLYFILPKLEEVQLDVKSGASALKILSLLRIEYC